MLNEDRLTLLGGFRLARGDAHVPVPRTFQRLLAFLGLHGPAHRGHVIGALWPESPERNASGSLRTALWRLGRLGCDVVSARQDTLALHPRVVVDVAALARWARWAAAGDGGPAPEADGPSGGPLGPEPRVHGPHELLPGWYDDWVLAERERLRQLYLRAMETLATRELRAGRCGEAMDAALAAQRVDPLRESPHRLLVAIHLAEGNYSEALHTYHAYRDLLARELGVAPSPGMTRLLTAPPRGTFSTAV